MKKVAFKIPHGFASYLCSQRELRTAYQTNREVKVFGFFALLKTLTSSGIIKNYSQQINEIAEYTHKSRTGTYNYISKCANRGLLHIENNSLVLHSWERIIQRYDDCIYTPVNTTVYYDQANKRQAPEYLIYACEISENQQRQQNAVIKQIEENLPLAQAIGVKQQVNATHVDKLQRLQVFTYVSSKSDPEYHLLHSINADVQRTAKTLRKAYGMKSRRTVKYLKKQLEKRGIAKVEKRLIVSQEQARVCPNTYYTGYNRANKTTWWKQPDSINIINPQRQ